jgi:hypothetical protein
MRTRVAALESPWLTCSDVKLCTLNALVAAITASKSC